MPAQFQNLPKKIVILLKADVKSVGNPCFSLVRINDRNKIDNFVNFIPSGLKFCMQVHVHDVDLICSWCSYHILTIKKLFEENNFFSWGVGVGGFWRPQFFEPNSETWSRAAQDMYVGACKVSEFISKNCNLAQSRRKINGKPLFLPREPKKVSFKPFLVINPATGKYYS